jgi:ethanolaminephosphotransferase
MSSAASNYDMSKLVMGQVLTASALILGSVAAWKTLTLSLRASYPLLLMSLLYGVMMFASSYVEEEQHFWYWITSAWLGMIWLKRYVLILFSGAKAYD